MEIRDACEEDIESIAGIERECFSMPWTPEQLRSQLRPGHVFLAACEDGEVVGYAGLCYVLDEGYISNVATAPGYRRRGTAAALLLRLEERARALGLAFLTLEVRESNLPARALYAKLGYAAVGCRRNYYQNPREDAILMTLELSENEGTKTS